LGEEFRVNTSTSGAQTDPDVVFDTSGRFVVVFTSDLDVHGQRFDHSGNSLGEEFTINTFTTLVQSRSAIAAGLSGEFVVVWQSSHQDGDDDGIFGQRFDASATPLGGEFRVNSETEEAQFWPDLATGADGGFIVVWTSRHLVSSSGPVISAQRFDASGNALGGEFQVNTTPVTVAAGAGTRASIASDLDGDFVVVWPNGDADYSGIVGQRFDPSGLSVGGEFRVNTPAAGVHTDPAVASDASGNLVIAWTRRNEGATDSDILAQRYDASGNALGAEFRVNSTTTPPPEYPSIASDADGDFIVAWHSPFFSSPSQKEVKGRAFDLAGAPLGDEFQINTYTSGNQLLPTVASDARGDVVIAWRNSSPGISAQRFAGPGLHIEVDGSCPGPVTVTILQAPPLSEVGIVAAANTNGFTKGGTLCAGTELEIGEPFALPPRWVVVDENGAGSVMFELPAGRCYLEALALADCTTSGAVSVP
jgi:hypothetical protein